MDAALPLAQPRLHPGESGGTLTSPRFWSLSMHRPAALAATAVALLGSACTREPVAPTEPMAMDGVRLVLEALPQEPACDPAQPYALRVRWEALDWPDPKFDFHLERSDGPLWARHNRAEGETVSDPWARPGLFILLVDRNTGLVAAAQPAPPLVCPPPA